MSPAAPGTDGPAEGADEQLSLVRVPSPRRARRAGVEELTAADPVARVAVEIGLAHLDRTFDYAVPESLAEAARPGVRVRVRFAGRLVDGFVLERAASTDHAGGVVKLSRLAKVVSPEPVLTPEIAEVARAVADRYAGTLADVLRLAVPPRHARAEAQTVTAATSEPGAGPEDATWTASTVHGIPSFGAALAAGKSPRAAWAVPAGTDWPAALAALAAATVASGRSAVLVVPDGRDLSRVDEALRAVLDPDLVVALAAELGPAERYRRWLAALRGAARVVVGTRAAAFAPTVDLGLVAIWDDGDDLHAEPRAPYPHVREVLATRAQLAGCGFLVAGHARTAEVARMLRTGWVRPLDDGRAGLRAAAPRVRTIGDDAQLARDPAARTARLPSLAWETARRGLAEGPVLVQVPRSGYAPGLACARCRASARCGHCAGPLATSSAGGVPACRLCARPAAGWRCPECDGRELRAAVVGAGRTAEELARAFPGTRVHTSGGNHVLSEVGTGPALVVATPGAEPVVADGGAYAAALLLDGGLLLSRTDLRAAEEAVRRWFNAAALVRAGDAGGEVVVVADPEALPVQALVRWDPAGFAERELADRAAVRLPPAARVATLTGSPDGVHDLVSLAELPASAEVLGPAPVDEPGGPADDEEGQVRTIVRVPPADGAALAVALRAAAAVRSARKDRAVVAVRIDPQVFG